MRCELSFPALQELLAEERILLFGALPRSEAEATLREHALRLRLWQEGGMAAEMAYMNRPPLTSLDNFLPSTQSVVLVGVPYDGSSVREPLQRGFGRVARYAWGRDYHGVLREKLNRVVEKVRHKLPYVEARVFSDAVPLPERALGSAAALGFRGKNTMLIRPGEGSFFFLGEILWNVEVTDSPRRQRRVLDFFAERPIVGCGGCTRCSSHCPTGALDTPGTLDARRCISFLTIEKRTLFTDEESALLGEWIFGCDECQEVCPYNSASLPPLKEFDAGEGVGQGLDLRELLRLESDEAFRVRFARTPLLRAKRQGLLRNACAVIANTSFLEGAPELRQRALDDPSELVRKAALQSLRRLLPNLDGVELMKSRRVLADNEAEAE